MADITEVLHEINYEVNTTGLENATVAIQHQMDELDKMSKALKGYTTEMKDLSSAQSKQFADLAKNIDDVGKQIKTAAGKSKRFADDEKKNLRTQIDSYLSLAKAAKTVYDDILKAQIEASDKEIAARERKVTAAKELAKRGNVEALRIEEEGLRKSLEQRERFAKRQQAVNAAITVSNAIAAVARAALEGGGFGSIATIASLVAALAAGYAAVQSLTNENTAFADGVVGFNGKGGPRDDKNWVRISNGESVITAEGTRKNHALLESINKGAVLQTINPSLPFTIPEFKQSVSANSNSYANAKDLQKLESKLDQVVDAIEDNKLKQNIFFNEHGVGIMTERAIQRDRKRWK